jgi:hypothetical protein
MGGLVAHLASARRLGRAQGLFNVVSGAWPIVSLRSFEAIFGPKTDVFLQKTSGLLFLSSGVALLGTEESEAWVRMARHLHGRRHRLPRDRSHLRPQG